ncbi:hypothetical protein PV08_06558 [Exophiala spinifera]|uniref:L-ascorbate oxidase n=1 Tax=Exophiala spinifera TaxID=91928 RepID=A0A0D2BC25_9EURO|nr:uncharacterized protein PV08_06558 [Exophiala spinifera]KIW16503.1 hypothetical protein PV08_06558 [Exophiala spinifera]
MSKFPPAERGMILIGALSPETIYPATAATVAYNWNITWTSANPDDAFVRPGIGVNGQWPPPQIEANFGDDIVVTVLNLLGNQSTSLHFHGLFMNGTTHMDGPAQVSQCSIPPGSSFTYRFKAAQVGTFWYHSHVKGQYVDGLRGSLIIHDPENPFRGDFDDEILLSVSDWYHQEMAVLLPEYRHGNGMMSREPVPDANLLNDTQNLQVPVAPEQTYLVRIVNVGAFAGQYFWIEGHTMTIVELDGSYTQPTTAEMIYLASGQRCSFLLTTKSEVSRNYPLMASMDRSLFMKADHVNANVTGWLVYNSSQPLLSASQIDEFAPIDDMTIIPYDQTPLLRKPDQSIRLNINMKHANGGSYYFFNDIAYASPEVPTLYTALTSGDSAAHFATYGMSSNPWVLERDQVIEVILYNRHMTNHPVHLHGHHFQAVWRSAPGAGDFSSSTVTDDAFIQLPVQRDTIVVPNGGSVVIRFRADNPGVWLLHCHMEWHAETGLAATFIEAPLDLQHQQQLQNITLEQVTLCTAAGTELPNVAEGKTHNHIENEEPITDDDTIHRQKAPRYAD